MPATAGRYTAASNNLALLQDVIRRDPQSYRDEFTQQLDLFEDHLRLIELQPNFDENSVDTATIVEVVGFLTATGPSFPESVSIFCFLSKIYVVNEL